MLLELAQQFARVGAFFLRSYRLSGFEGQCAQHGIGEGAQDDFEHDIAGQRFRIVGVGPVHPLVQRTQHGRTELAVVVRERAEEVFAGWGEELHRGIDQLLVAAALAD